MKTTADDRLLRAIKLLEGALHPKAGPLLASRGFDDDAIAEGWALLHRALGYGTPAAARPSAPFVGEQSVVRALDEWLAAWLDVADAALTRLHPELREKLFDGVGRRVGRAAVTTVAHVLERLDAFERAAEHDEQAAAAVAALARRGLDAAERRRARALLAKLDRRTVDTSVLDAERATARAALWAWTKDWAKTARTVVADKRLRQQIGVARARDLPDRRTSTVPPLQRRRTGS